jgi:hypothetical protein
MKEVHGAPVILTRPAPPESALQKKSAARGLPLAAIGIDFNRILLSA